jgi:Fe-S-cluster-containing dehydrogenase component
MTAGTTPVRPPAFLHDLNTCVGCHACVIACVNEHQLEAGRFWRQIVSFNSERRPGHPTFHLSLACNHCLDAPCERACPAVAISRDRRTGAVVIDDASCIGCRYCAWVCPFDAPRFNETLGVMQKCTLCTHRLAVDLQPACVSLCPTGALRLTAFEEDAHHAVAGFPQSNVRPAIGFVPLRARALDLQVLDAAATDAVRAMPSATTVISAAGRTPAPKISLRSEWTLAAFTFSAILLVAWFVASCFGGPTVRLLPFGILGLGAMALSTLHLGRKSRAWRAVLNVRRSWLSREVLAFPAFLALAVTSVLLPALPAPQWVTASVSWLAILAGASCLICIDRVYAAMARPDRFRRDDAAAFASAALLAGVFSGTPWLFVAGGLDKLLASAGRTLSRGQMTSQARQARAVVRVSVGLGVPCALWLAGGSAPVAAACVLLGEALDRADFYDSLDIVTPAATMARQGQRKAYH